MTRNEDRCDRDQDWSLPETKYVYIGIPEFIDMANGYGRTGVPEYFHSLEAAKAERERQTWTLPTRITYRLYQIREWDRELIKAFTLKGNLKNWIECEFWGRDQ